MKLKANWHCNLKSVYFELRLCQRLRTFPLFSFWLSRGDIHVAIFPLVFHIGTMKFIKPSRLTPKEMKLAKELEEADNAH